MKKQEITGGRILIVDGHEWLADYASGKAFKAAERFTWIGTIVNPEDYERHRWIQFRDSDENVVMIDVKDDTAFYIDGTKPKYQSEADMTVSWNDMLLLDDKAYEFLQAYCPKEDLEEIQFTKIKRKK